MDFNAWLEEHGLSKYADIFAENDIDEAGIFAEISEEELQALGIPLGARKKIARAVSGETKASAPSSSEAVVETSPAYEQPYQAARPMEAGQPAAPPESESHSFDTLPVDPHGETPYEQPAPAGIPLGTGEVHASPPRFEPKGKSSRKATAILVAVAVHVAIILIATTLTIFAASKDEPEIIAEFAPPSANPQQEMKKKTVQKQVKSAPSSSAAAAPMAQMMKANATAQFSVPDVTRTSTGPLGMGEGDLGTGAFGSGLGDGQGGGMFFGSQTKGRPAVIFDVSASMYKVVPAVVAEIKKSFQQAQVVTVLGCKFSNSARDNSHKLVPHKSNKEVLAWIRTNGRRNAETRDAMNKALFSLPNCISLSEKTVPKPGGPGLQSMGKAIELLLAQPSHERPSTIFIFADFNDGIDKTYVNSLRDKLKENNTKVVLFQAMGKFAKRDNKAAIEKLIQGTDGELKIGISKG